MFTRDATFGGSQYTSLLQKELGLTFEHAEQIKRGMPLPENLEHREIAPILETVSDILAASIRYGLDHRVETVQYALRFARDMGRDLADRFVGMYVNHWTLDYGEKGRESVERFLGRAFERGLIPHRQKLEFVR